MKTRNILFLHIGTHKTVSSALQSVMLKINNKLRREGICYLGCPKYFCETLSATTNNNISLSSKSDKVVSNTVAELRTQIKRENIFGRYKFIISSEKFSGDIHSGYRDAGNIAETWSKIIKQLDVDVRIIVYLRSQDDFIQSLYTQLIHQGESLSFNEFKMHFSSESFNWQLLLSHYENSFSKDRLIVRRYTKSDLPDKSSLFFDFGSIIGSQALVSHDQQNLKNSGYSRNALEIARTLNPNLSSGEKRTMRKLLQKVSSKTLHEEYDYFEDDNRLEFFQRYYKSNQIVARKYFGEEALFNEPDISKFAKDYAGLTVEGMLDIYKKTIEEVEKTNESSSADQSVSVKRMTRNMIKNKMPFLDKFINLIKGQYN